MKILRGPLSDLLRWSCFTLLISLSSGCSLIYKSTGDILINYAEDQAVPYLMATDDPTMACAMSEGMGPLFFSFGTVTTPPDKLATLLYLMTAMCSEEKAWNEELRYLRAVQARNISEAQDARIAEKRYLALTAQRQLRGYEALVRSYGEPGGKCPKLKTDNDELYWLVGLLDGVQGLFSDLKAEGAAGVPLDVASRAARGSECIDTDKWWGLPLALRAAVWTAIPSTKPKNEDPYARLDEASKIGLRQGVRVAQVLELQIYLGQGKVEKAKEIIRAHAKAKKTSPSDPQLVILDEVATRQILAVSDRMWTEATGKRTPIGGLGTFWDDKKKEVESLDLDSIL